MRQGRWNREKVIVGDEPRETFKFLLPLLGQCKGLHSVLRIEAH